MVKDVKEEVSKEVPELNVKFVMSVIEMGVLVFIVSVLDPRFIDLTLELLDDICPQVKLKFLVSNVPLVTVSVRDPMFSASASSTVPP